MTDADWLLLYAFSKIEDAELRNVLYRNRLDEALNILLVELSKKNIHFKIMVRHYGVRPDVIFEDTLSHIVTHIHKFVPRFCASKPQTGIRSYVITIIRSLWADRSHQLRSQEIYKNQL
jgi:hypothetical protein